MAVRNPVLKDRLGLSNKTRTLRIETFQERKSIHLFHLYSDASEIYFQKDLFRLSEAQMSLLSY